MSQKVVKTGVFLACLATLGGGSYLTYGLFSGPVLELKSEEESAPLASEPAAARKSGSLLSTSPYTAEVTHKAENRARTRSPAFQREATLDEKTIERFRTLVKSRKLSKEDDLYRTYLPDESGVGFLVRTLLVVQIHGDKNPDDAGVNEGLGYIRTYFNENAGRAVQAMDLALGAISKDKDFAPAKSLLMSEMAHLGREKSDVRAQVKSYLLEEYRRVGAGPQGALALSILVQMQDDPKWVQEVKESFEKAHPGDSFSEIVSIHQSASL